MVEGNLYNSPTGTHASKRTWPPESPNLAPFRGPHLAVDVVLFSVVKRSHSKSLDLAFLLYKRGEGLAAREWALPGRMVRERERLNEAVEIALLEKCGIKGIEPKQLYVFDEPTRDDRGWVMSVGYVTTQRVETVADVLRRNRNLALGFVHHKPDQYSELELELPDGQLALPFEQEAIVNKGVADLQKRYDELPDPDFLLGEKFTLYQLRMIHEAVLGQPLDKDLFRRKMGDRLNPTSEKSIGSVGKPAQLFTRLNGYQTF